MGVILNIYVKNKEIDMYSDNEKNENSDNEKDKIIEQLKLELAERESESYKLRKYINSKLDKEEEEKKSFIENQEYIETEENKKRKEFDGLTKRVLDKFTDLTEYGKKFAGTTLRYAKIENLQRLINNEKEFNELESRLKFFNDRKNVKIFKNIYWIPSKERVVIYGDYLNTTFESLKEKIESRRSKKKNTEKGRGL